jgi:undecaprenyl-diphosphatase
VNTSDPAPDEPCVDADSRATDDLLGTVVRIDDLLGTVDRIDDLIDEWWERFRGNEVIDRVFYTASEAADFSILWHAIGVAKAMVRDDPRIAIELSVALGIESALVNGPVKSLFRRNRPVHDVPRPHALRQPKTSSFPSGHASAAMVAASLLSRRSRYRLLWYLLAFVVAASRAHVRIHHASDVVGGAAVGIGLGATARRLARRLRPS